MTDSSTSGGGAGSRADRLDSLFLVLADEYRRHVLRYFVVREDTSAAVDDVIDYVLERHPGERTRTDLERRFHHYTLPKLVDHGVIEFDHRSHTIRYRGTTTLETILCVVEEADLRAE